MKFADNSGTSATTLGKDSSGNSNNFTPSNFSVSAGSGNDSLEDTPTNNFSIINPLAGYQTTFEVPTNGNLDFSLANGEFAFSSFEIPTSGKWYVEVVFTTFASGRCGITNLIQKNTTKWNGIDNLGGEIRVDDSAVQSSLSPTIGDNKIVGIKVDRDAGTIAWEVDGSAAGTAVNISSMSDPNNLVFAVGRNSSGGSAPTGSINFGQRPFSHLPSGYQSLCSANLPDPTILLPKQYFGILTYGGNSSTQTITDTDAVNFTPDFVWVKRRDGDNSHILTDAVRGVHKFLVSSRDNDEGDNSAFLTAFNNGGFTVGNNGDMNGSSRTYVAWNWNAGGSTATNSNGTISSQVRASATAGFSIVTYTGNGTGGATVGHGLGVAPQVIFVKRRNAADDWRVNIGAVLGSGKDGHSVKLNSTGGENDANNLFNSTNASSTVFTIGTDADVNGNTSTYVAYCFSSVTNYCKIGTFEGNSNANGSFVNLGFKPAWLLLKQIDGESGAYWLILDSTRRAFNPNGPSTSLYANANDTENTFGNGTGIDFLSNGFKIRDSLSYVNLNTVFFIAFAESPFKNARAV